jgi:adenosylhomocysteine nucleosidase
MWQQLLSNWIARQAKARAFEHAAAAAREAFAPNMNAPRDRSGGGGRATSDTAANEHGADEHVATDNDLDGAPTGPQHCHAAFVFALGIESGGLEDLLSGRYVTQGAGFTVHHGLLRARPVVVVQTGVGCQRASRATEALLAGHRADWVISAGFAGGLRPGIARGDIVMVDSLVSPTGQRRSLDLRVDPVSLARTPGVHVGRLVTRDALVRTSAAKLALGQEHDALAVDMETWAVAEVCRAAGQRFLAIRVISDPSDEELPADIEGLIQQTTLAGQFGAAMGTLWRRPSSAKDLLRLKEQALVCTDRLARFLADMLEQLVPRGSNLSKKS